MLSEDCKNRLYNFKFDRAINYLDENTTTEERELVEALASVFGSPGWFDGHLSTIVWAALRSVGVLGDN